MRVRQAVRALARSSSGFSLVDQTKIVTAASELARNTLDYGGGGDARLEVLRDGARRGLRLTFEDQGPGIPDIEQALKDGYTTGSGLGWASAAPSGCRTSSRSTPGPAQGTTRDAHPLEVRHARRSVSADAEPRWPRRAGRRAGHARRRSASTRTTAGQVRPRRHRAGDQSGEARRRRSAASCGPIADATGGGLEMLGLDKGPGMADVGRCLADGYSTAGSPGTGLGAVAPPGRRLRRLFAPRPGHGCHGAHLRPGDAVPAPTPPIVCLGAVVVPIAGETVMRRRAGRSARRRCGPAVMVVDGSATAPGRRRGRMPPSAAFERHAAERLRAADRDACIALWRRRAAPPWRSPIDLDSARPCCASPGVGNIAGVLAGRGQAASAWCRTTAPLGHVAPRIQEFTYPCQRRRDCWSCTPTGCRTHWDLDPYPGLGRRHPSLIAGVLYRDHRRERDDVTVS